MSNKPLTLTNVNGQTVHVSHPEKTLSLALKIQEKLESCKNDNGLASELYEFTADLSKKLSHHKTTQKLCKRQN